MKRRVLALALAILAFFIFVGSPFQQTAEAVLLVDDAFIAVLVALLAAAGITFVTTGAFSNTVDYVSDQFNQYCSSIGSTPAAEVQGVQFGRNRLGQLLLNNRFLVLSSAFIIWLKAKLNLQDNSSQNVVFGDYTLVDDDGNIYDVANSYDSPNGTVLYTAVRGVAGQDKTITFNYGEVEIKFRSSAGSYRVDYVNTVTGESNYNVFEWQYAGSTATSRNLYFCYWSGNANNPPGVYVFGFQGIYSNSSPAYGYAYLHSMTGYLKDADVDIITDVITPPNTLPGFDDDVGGILDVDGTTWGETLPDITDGTIPGEFSDSRVGDATLTLEQDSAIADQVTEAGNPSISSSADDYTVSGLADVFPFCIPFDLYNFVSCLAADPVAPSFSWRFYVPGICDETIEIDFSDFDQAAQLLRTMELLLFCVGLAFVTRKIIRG